MVDVVPNVLRNLVAGASVHTTSSLHRSLEVAFHDQRSDLAIVAGVLVVDSHRVGVVWKLKLAVLRHIVVSKLNQLFGNLFGGGLLVDLHREDTMTDFYKKSSKKVSVITVCAPHRVNQAAVARRTGRPTASSNT